MWSNPTGEEYSSAGETKAVRYDRFQHTSVLGRIKVWTYSIPPKNVPISNATNAVEAKQIKRRM